MTSGVHPRHLYALPIVGGCALDPSKTLVAYVVTSPDETSNGYRGRIKVVKLADGEIRELTHGTARDGTPQWSADGSSLFFSSDRGGSTQLWQIYLGGGEPKPLPEVPEMSPNLPSHRRERVSPLSPRRQRSVMKLQGAVGAASRGCDTGRMGQVFLMTCRSCG